MDRAILEGTAQCPSGLPLILWEKYLAGTKAYDNLYAQRVRCPSNTEASCLCPPMFPSQTICKIWHRIVEIEAEIKAMTGWEGVTGRME